MSKYAPLIHKGIAATRIYRSAPPEDGTGREIDRAVSPESAALMRDLFMIIDFDLNIQYYQRQPVAIEYTDPSGDSRAFTPEFLITYRRDIVPARRMKPLLCDVMTRKDLFENWAKLLPRIRAAHRYARGRGWRYQMLTECELRTPYLDNAGFLLPYQRLKTDWGHARPLLDMLYELRQADTEALLAACARNDAHRAELLTSLWHLVALWRIGADLSQPLTIRSTIWSKD